MFKNYCFIIFFWLSLPLLTSAQDNVRSKNSIHRALTFHLLDVESGLSNNFINSIEEDDIGRIWIATSDGLNVYDGFMFKEYKTSNSKGFTNKNISQLGFDTAEKNLILATDDGLDVYNPRLEHFKPLFNNANNPNRIVNCFVKNKKSQIFLSLLRSEDGLYVEKDSGNIVPYWEVYGQHEAMSNIEISSLKLQNDSILWIGTFHTGLHKFDLVKNKVKSLNTNNSRIPNTVNTVFIDDTENIWVGTKEGLQVISKDNDTLYLGISNKFEKGLSDDSVLSIEEDKLGRIWIGTRNGGLNILNKTDFLENKQVNIKWFLPKSDGSSVFNRTVSCIKKDHNGNMWLGTSTGLNFVNPTDEPVKLIQHNITNPNRLSHNRIGSLALAGDGKIWIGTDGGGLDLLDPQTSTFKHFKHEDSNPNSLSNNYIISVFEDSQRRVWVGTYQGGINLLNPETGKAKTYLPEEDVRVIFEDHQNQIWVGTNRAGLFKYDNISNSFQFTESLGKIDIRDIEQAEDHSLWLATFGDGLIQFVPETNTIERFSTITVKDLPTDVFFSLEILKNGSFLMGSRYEGLILFDPENKSISKFTEEDGLSNNSVVSILKENDEFYWLGTNNGINRYSVKQHKTYNLSTLNNIQTSAFNINSAVKSKEGHLYFGGNKGLNIFYPKRLENEKQDAKLIFNRLSVLNAPVKIKEGEEDAVLNQSIGYADAIKLNHDQSLFSIAFTLLKYPQAKNINYSYRLEGYDDRWITSDGLNEANYSNTPPGEYTFKVKANLDSGEEVVNQIDVIIQPPFWKTLPAYFLYIVILILLIYFGMKYYSERIKLKNSLIFEQKQRQLEHEINEERMHFFTNFSHELKTPLTLILAPLDDLINHVKSDKHLQQLQLIKKNADLLYQYINKLLDFRKSETGHSQLELQKCNINQILSQIENAFKSLTQKNNIKFSGDYPTEDVFACVDLEKFQIILNNLISNAVKHTEKGGRISLTLRLDTAKDMLTIEVKDTGKGINEKDLPFIFNWYYQAGGPTRKKGTGVGLALTKNFVELHGGEISVINNHNSSGVSFSFVLPLRTELFSQYDLGVEVSPEDHKQNLLQPTAELFETEDKSKNIRLQTERKLVLLVDDNSDILSYLETLLAEAYDLIFAGNGQEGIEKALEYVPDIIISDVMMPKKNGIELCHFLKNEKSTSHIPIILLTAKGNHESIKTGYTEGADDYVTKPFNSEILQTRLINLLSNREKLRVYFSTDEPLNAQLSSSNLKLIDKEKKFLMDLKAMILKNLKENEDFSVDTLAEQIGMSRSSLYRKISAMTDGNINDFIRKVKLEKAAYLIKNEGVTISQASYEVGFNSVNYFRKIFKKEYGKLPSDYKEDSIESS